MKKQLYRKRRLRWMLSVIGIVLVTARVATWPVETRQGVNFVVSTYTQPLYLKAFEFVDRSAHYERLANTITEGLRSDSAKVEKLFQWTVQNIQPTPDDWSVVDDHILNIIIRGHGVADQRADVFTTLATYSGVPAFWVSLPKHSDAQILLSFVFVDDRWVVADVANGFQFRNSEGELATLDELVAQPARLKMYAAERTVIKDVSYAKVFSGLTMPKPQSPLRAELQMPLKRLIYEARAMLSLGTNDESD
jgi:hypothetical protein